MTTNAQLWQEQAFLHYVRPGENAWQYDVFGTKRSLRMPATFFDVREDLSRPSESDVFPYMEAAVVTSQRHRSVLRVFAARGNAMYFDVRGMMGY